MLVAATVLTGGCAGEEPETAAEVVTVTVEPETPTPTPLSTVTVTPSGLGLPAACLEIHESLGGGDGPFPGSAEWTRFVTLSRSVLARSATDAQVALEPAVAQFERADEVAGTDLVAGLRASTRGFRLFRQTCL